MDGMVQISKAAEQLGVTSYYLRPLEWQGRVPPARHDLNERFYSEFDIALLRSMGVGSRPWRLKSAEEALKGRDE
jgi:DNA-binding transcriptional MerR regulator